LKDKKGGQLGSYKQLSGDDLQKCVDEIPDWGAGEYPGRDDERVSKQNQWVKDWYTQEENLEESKQLRQYIKSLLVEFVGAAPVAPRIPKSMIPTEIWSADRNHLTDPDGNTYAIPDQYGPEKESLVLKRGRLPDKYILNKDSFSGYYLESERTERYFDNPKSLAGFLTNKRMKVFKP
jgi:hypothetical protein